MLSSTIFHAFNCHSPGTYVASTAAFVCRACACAVISFK
jgi:hypothetical protein